MARDISQLVERLKTHQRDIEAVLRDAHDDDAHHLRCALRAIQTAIDSVEERFHEAAGSRVRENRTP
jgi:hypothetical protein